MNPFAKSADKNELTISPDNPFREKIIEMQRSIKDANRTIVAEEITVTVRKEYLSGTYTKLYQNKELLAGLTPDACKILMHIALNLRYNSERIKLLHTDVGIDRRRVSRGIKELLTKNIISRDKREWYWVNVTLLVVGKVAKLPDAAYK